MKRKNWSKLQVAALLDFNNCRLSVLDHLGQAEMTVHAGQSGGKVRLPHTQQKLEKCVPLSPK